MRNVIVVIVYGSISDSRSIPIARYILLIDCFRVRCSSCLKGCFSSPSVSPVDDTLTLWLRHCRVLLLIHSTNESSFIVHDSLLVFRLTRTERTKAILSPFGRLARKETKEREQSFRPWAVSQETKERNEIILSSCEKRNNGMKAIVLLGSFSRTEEEERTIKINSLAVSQ